MVEVFHGEGDRVRHVRYPGGGPNERESAMHDISCALFTLPVSRLVGQARVPATALVIAYFVIPLSLGGPIRFVCQGGTLTSAIIIGRAVLGL